MRLLFILLIALTFLPIIAQARESNLSVSTYGEIGKFKPSDTSFLGNGTAATPQFNLVDTETSAEYHKYGVEFSYDLDHNQYAKQITSLFGSVNIANIIDRQKFGIINTGGSNLLIPGVGAGTGFELGGFPANSTDNTKYRYKADQSSFDFGLKQTIKKKSSRFSLTPFAGLKYQNFDSNTKFSANVPLFLESFDYNTNIEVNSISPFIGTDFAYAITPTISLIGTFKYLYDINYGQGDDTLNFTAVGTQSANMQNDENTHSAEVQAGLNFQLSQNIDFSVTAKYGRYGNIPVMETRTNMRASDFNYKTGEIITGGARLTVQF